MLVEWVSVLGIRSAWVQSTVVELPSPRVELSQALTVARDASAFFGEVS